MAAISRRSSWPSTSGDKTGKSGDIPTLLRPKTRLRLRTNVADVDQTALEEAGDESPRERTCVDTSLS